MLYENSDAAAYTIRSVLGASPGKQLFIEYDFGDGWAVKLTLEAVIEDKALPGRELPRILKGRSYGIIEDRGDPAGPKQIAETFQKRAERNTKLLKAGLSRMTWTYLLLI